MSSRFPRCFRRISSSAIFFSLTVSTVSGRQLSQKASHIIPDDEISRAHPTEQVIKDNFVLPGVGMLFIVDDFAAQQKSYVAGKGRRDHCAVLRLNRNYSSLSGIKRLSGRVVALAVAVSGGSPAESVALTRK